MAKNNLKIFTLAALICVILLILYKKNNSSTNYNQKLENYNVNLEIIDKNNKRIANFDVALADNDEIRSYGLMNLNNLPKNHGMLFLFKKEQIIAMWMKNTKISLDMLFIDKNNNIVNIKHRAKPYSLDIISSEIKSNRVLEVNGGLAKELNIKIGHKIKIK